MERRRGAGVGEKARHGSGIAEAAFAAPQGTARRGRREERRRGAACMERRRGAGMGEKARHGSGIAEAAPAAL